MFKLFKKWLYWWKLSRKAKRYLKEEARISKMSKPYEYDEKTRQAVIEDWQKAGHDITVPNFSGGTHKLGI